MIDSAFTNPAHDTARCFRAILDAIAHPGRITPFAPPLQAPPGLGEGAAAIALTLCDFQTSIWLDGPLRSPEIIRYLSFHTGAPMAGVAATADFIFTDARHGAPDPRSLKRGSHAYPDRSASLVMIADTLVDGGPLELTGPGIKKHRHLDVAPLDWSFWASLAQCNGDYPLGIDLFVATATSLAAIPRSTRIALAGAA